MVRYFLGSSVIFCSFLLFSCSSSSANRNAASPATPTPSASSDTQPQSPAAQIDPCSMFSAADAQAIMGAPMKLLPGHGAIVCMYELASPKSGSEFARVSLTLNVNKSPEEENRA